MILKKVLKCLVCSGQRLPELRGELRPEIGEYFARIAA